MHIFLQFLAISGIILWAGTRLSRYADIIAEKTGLGRTFIGVVLLASVTSLPELMTGISAVAVFDVPNIAVGDVLGSCMFNLLILALMDSSSGPLPLSARTHSGQVLTAGFGIVLLGLTGISIAAAETQPALGWIGVSSVLALLIYLLAMRVVFLYERRRIAEFVEEVAEEARYTAISSRRAYAMYGVYGVMVVAAASALPYLGQQLAVMTGLGETFVGNLLIAASTSMPEIVVSVAALRVAAIDMVYGNLLGSNLFNMAILAVDDIAYTRGPLLSQVTGGHLVVAQAASVMTALAIIGLTYRTRRKPLPVAWDSLGILAVYLATAVHLYVAR